MKKERLEEKEEHELRDKSQKIKDEIKSIAKEIKDGDLPYAEAQKQRLIELLSKVEDAADTAKELNVSINEDEGNHGHQGLFADDADLDDKERRLLRIFKLQEDLHKINVD